MRVVKHISLVCLLLLAALNSHAQFKNMAKANEYFQAKKLDTAKIYIDSVIVNQETKNDYESWMLRGFIYKELYKVKENTNPASPLRDIAVESYKKSLALDTANQNKNKPTILQSLKYVASTYHNDINKTLDTLKYEQSLKNAAKFKEITKFLDPAFKEKDYDYEVYLNVGSMFEREFERNDSKNSLDLAKVYLFKAFELDSNKLKVTKNIGLLYYNQAVTIIKKMDYDIPLDQIPVYQDQSVKFALQTLPYLLKAYKIDPTDRAVIEGLAGVYYLLNENEKHNEFKKKLEELK